MWFGALNFSNAHFSHFYRYLGELSILVLTYVKILAKHLVYIRYEKRDAHFAPKTNLNCFTVSLEALANLSCREWPPTPERPRILSSTGKAPKRQDRPLGFWNAKYFSSPWVTLILVYDSLRFPHLSALLCVSLCRNFFHVSVSSWNGDILHINKQNIDP